MFSFDIALDDKRVGHAVAGARPPTRRQVLHHLNERVEREGRDHVRDLLLSADGLLLEA